MKRKILLIDFWGLGDLVLASGALHELVKLGYEVGVLTKPLSKALTVRTFPGVHWHTVNIPWTAHQGKYRLHEWNWKELAEVISEIRGQSYDYSISIRKDPREDFIPWLAGITQVYGFRRWSWWSLINKPAQIIEGGHRVELWQSVLLELTGRRLTCQPSLLAPPAEPSQRLLIHVGASVKVRRWFLSQWQELINQLQSTYNYPVEVVADLDGFGSGLQADYVYQGQSLELMTALLGSSLLVIGNDSGPTHIAASYGVPTVTVFGPQKTEYFRPWSERAFVVEGGDCPYKPCSDYCRWSSPKCLEAVTVSEVLAQVGRAMKHVEK